MIRLLIAATLLCVACSSAYARVKTGHDRGYPGHYHYRTETDNVAACDVMRPCYGNGRLIYDSAVAQDSVSGRRATRHRARHETHRRVPEGLYRVMAEGAGRVLGVVRSAHGATAHVASRAAGAFQCLVDALDRQGYPIRFMGGWRAHGSVKASLHPAGLALDINQYARNRTRPRMPSNEIALANSCGLVSGAQWGWADSGHFQLGGWAGHTRSYARVRTGHHSKHYASEP